MARIRTIKPEFCTSEQVVSCSRDARLMFVLLWCFCDDRGVHPDSPQRIKMEVYPGDEDITPKHISKYIDELTKANLLARFSDDSGKFLAVTGWHHQKIDKPTNKYPAPPDFGEIRRAFDERSATEGSVRESSVKEESGGEGSHLCSEPQAASEQLSSWTFPVAGGSGSDKQWTLPVSKLAEFEESYPGVDLAAELREARQWCRDNPAKRKTRSGMTRFLSRWLARAQNEGASTNSVRRRSDPRGNLAAMQAFIGQGEK